MNSGIYQIMNKINYHMYIGSAINLDERWRLHRVNLQSGVHHCIHLQRAWNKDGEDAFEFSEIEFVDRDNLVLREQYYFDLLKPEYNICKNAGSTLGVRMSEEAKQKMSIAKTGIKQSEEHKRKRADKLRGKSRPIDVCLKISTGLIGRELPEESRLKISKSLQGNKNALGSKYSDEIKQKMRTDRLGKKRGSYKKRGER